MLTRPPPAAPPWSDGCGSCHSLERCASALNERTDTNSSSILRIGCPWPRSSSRNAIFAGSNRPFRRVLFTHRRHQPSLFTACAGMKDCSRRSVRSTELELRRSYSAQQTISTGLCPRSGRPPFVKQQARLAGPTLSELASVSGARRSAIQPSRARRRLADDTKRPRRLGDELSVIW